MADDYQKVNPILRRIMAAIYRDRPSLPADPKVQARTERVQDGVFYEIWFMTPGCSHDALGGCTMCNYGKGFSVSPEVVLEAIRPQLQALPPQVQELIITPTGSMLDDQEVPRPLREQILRLFHQTECHDFIIETRADTVTAEKLSLLKDSIRAECICVELGIECCSDWVLRNCVNKNMTMSDALRAAELCHAAGVQVCANVGIGIPFLSERCSIELAKRSLHQLLAAGFDHAVLFPYHVKPGTLSARLWVCQAYQCCSLWAIPEVLSDFSAEDLERIQISWYRNYYTDKKKILASPQTAPEHMEQVLSLLDGYKNRPGADALRPLLELPASDRDEWRCALSVQHTGIDMEGIGRLYRDLAEDFGIPRRDVDAELEHMRHTLEGEEICLS